MRIFKYPLEVGCAHNVYMPRGAQVLHVHEQNGVPTLWALVDPTQEEEARLFSVVGTGWGISDLANNATYRGTAHCGSFVWHVFEDGK